jgi:transcriptional regulator with XRE-family HTH domain
MNPQDAFVTRLRRYRERNRISLDEIAAATRVKRELLEAMERNDLSGWPRGLYARSWVRAYATVVGLDPSDTVDEFCRLFPHGDRRTGGTIQEMAAIVAHASEYRDEFDRRQERRQGAPEVDVPAQPTWYSGLVRRAQAVRWRLAPLFRTSPSARLKGTPGASA